MNDTEDDNTGDSPESLTQPSPPTWEPNVEVGTSPFATTPGDLAGAEQPVLAQLAPACPPPLKIWPTLLVAILALPASWVIAGVVLGLAGLVLYGPSAMKSPDWIAQLSQSRSGLLLLVVPGQLVFLAASLGAASLSSETIRQRLALERGLMPRWTWGVFALATPVIGFGSSLLLSVLVDEPSEQLRLLSDMMRTHAQGGFLVVLLLLVAVVPGFVEELLFRGYLQSRLLRRWPPIAAIAFSTLLFGAAHMDPVHIIGVLPLGIWLGVVAWRTGSVGPAMLCHGINNAVAVAGTIYSDPEIIEVTFDPMSIAVLAVSGPAMLFSFVILAMGRSSET